MKFQKGKSGNPAGRPKGCINHKRAIFEKIVQPHLEELCLVAIRMALEGNEAMLKLFLERALPPRPRDEIVNDTISHEEALKELA